MKYGGRAGSSCKNSLSRLRRQLPQRGSQGRCGCCDEEAREWRNSGNYSLRHTARLNNPSVLPLARHRLGGARETPPRSRFLPTMAKTAVRRARTPHRGVRITRGSPLAQGRLSYRKLLPQISQKLLTSFQNRLTSPSKCDKLPLYTREGVIFLYGVYFAWLPNRRE